MVSSILMISNFGPIKEANIGVKEFLILTGTQASGKSTVAKLIYFFTTFREMLILNQLSNYQQHPYTLKQQVSVYMHKKLFLLFGEYCLTTETKIKYIYDNGEYISLSGFYDDHFKVVFSPRINEYLIAHASEYVDALHPDKNLQEKWNVELDGIFDTYAAVYIPAGRSITSSLGKYFYYWYATMSDEQKDMLDYSIREYIEEVMRIDPFLDKGIKGLYNKYRDKLSDLRKKSVNILMNDAHKLIKGKYYFRHGIEKLELDSGEEIDMQQASSGQQEAVGIVNILMYHLLTQRKVLFIIEEPEAHLFPDGQTLITRLIAIAHNAGNNVVLTTHSPYILGELNNLIFAEKISKDVARNDLDEIVTDFEYLKYDECGAFFIKEGLVESCLDPELPGIKNEVIDDAAIVINEQFEDMLALMQEK